MSCHCASKPCHNSDVFLGLMNATHGVRGPIPCYKLEEFKLFELHDGGMNVANDMSSKKRRRKSSVRGHGQLYVGGLRRKSSWRYLFHDVYEIITVLRDRRRAVELIFSF